MLLFPRLEHQLRWEVHMATATQHRTISDTFLDHAQDEFELIVRGGMLRPSYGEPIGPFWASNGLRRDISHP